MSAHTAENTSEPASRWKSEGKTLGVRVNGRDLYPAFQFEDGAPRLIIKRILDVLPNEMSAWQKAIWFASGNGWLDGANPQGCLENGESVIDAASQLTVSACG